MQISANGLAIEIDDQGPANAEPLLMIMGLGMQLIAWPDGLVQRLLAEGFRVIRFDNRDAGLSQQFDHLGVPNIALASVQHLLHLPVRSPYSLADMARDALGVLDALGLQRAHICGASMGGMIAQQLALQAPERVKSLTLIMTSSGSRRLPGPAMRVRSALLSRPADPHDFAALAERNYKLFRLIGSPAYPAPEAELRQRIAASLRRSNRPQGVLRQLAAIAADNRRAGQLGRIKAPTLIQHGDQDPLIPVAAAHDLARRIPGAHLDIIKGMGHDLPEQLWPRFVAGIKSVAELGV
ncbi:alpha/beta fold hydrolase [Roseateles oligotrophus]|uniref:Alpha/beta fold hydrolase n=1 Tax=Roseateles oligotrophus TaxID=1769250 RepID=A0ABT2YKX9_9BURK|nr:alpha/beta fold hydrolase [Roseateles oligotrophus]MCV2370709.1 alpha/beta fold hydrolase [Roseateles oligotrophus]